MLLAPRPDIEISPDQLAALNELLEAFSKEPNAPLVRLRCRLNLLDNEPRLLLLVFAPELDVDF